MVFYTTSILDTLLKHIMKRKNNVSYHAKAPCMRLIAAVLFILIVNNNPVCAQVYFSEDFETVTTPALPVGWATTTTGTTGWKTHSGSKTFTGTWMIPAHTQYAMIDDWNNPADINNPGKIFTPIINLSTATNPYLSFDYYYTGASYMGGAESCIIEVSTNGGIFYNLFAFLPAKYSGGWHPIYLDVSAYAGQANVSFAITYMDGNDTLMGAAIDNIKVFDPPANDIELKTISPFPGGLTAYGIATANISLGGTIFNNGLNTITSFALKYQEGSGPVVTDNITGLNVAPFTNAPFSAITPFTLPATLGDYHLKFWAELPGDANPLNDSDATTLTTVTHMPVKKILAEEGTGTWCGWCPRGAVYMDSLANNSYNSSFSLVAVHNADTMTVPAYDAKIDSIIGGYPSVAIDRRQEVDPNKLINIYNEQKDYFGYADIVLSYLPATGNNYALKVSVTPVINMTGDYRLALALTENYLTGVSAAWEQENYYSFQMGNIPLTGAGLDWQAEPKKVPASKMHYNHVARGIFPDPNGAYGSLPATMTAGTTYDYTFNIPLEAWWDRSNDKMHAVVMLIRNADGHVLNSNNTVVPPLGISDMDAGINHLLVYPNPAYDKAYIHFILAEKSVVHIKVTDALGRVINTISKTGMESGEHKLAFDLSALSTGVYNLTVQTGKGSTSTRLSVIK